ncbi:MAG: hypothetical protein ACKO2G_08310 [Verrucomicrobiales bacterium]
MHHNDQSSSGNADTSKLPATLVDSSRKSGVIVAEKFRDRLPKNVSNLIPNGLPPPPGGEAMGEGPSKTVVAITKWVLILIGTLLFITATVAVMVASKFSKKAREAIKFEKQNALEKAKEMSGNVGPPG